MGPSLLRIVWAILSEAMDVIIVLSIFAELTLSPVFDHARGTERWLGVLHHGGHHDGRNKALIKRCHAWVGVESQTLQAIRVEEKI